LSRHDEKRVVMKVAFRLGKNEISKEKIWHIWEKNRMSSPLLKKKELVAVGLSFGLHLIHHHFHSSTRNLALRTLLFSSTANPPPLLLEPTRAEGNLLAEAFSGASG
jgi:hypothetical protein